MKNYVERGAEPNFPESVLVHPTHTDGLVDGGDVVVIGDLVGVAACSADSTTQLMAISLVGVFNLPVNGNNGTANAAIPAGTKVYVDGTTPAALNSNTAKVWAGWTLDPVNSGATVSVRVLLKQGARA